LNVLLPESLHTTAREVAEQEGVSVNDLIVTALAEKLGALQSLDDPEQRAQQANEADWDEILAQVPDVEPEAHDRFQ
jgi:hypothetical protein